MKMRSDRAHWVGWKIVPFAWAGRLAVSLGAIWLSSTSLSQAQDAPARPPVRDVTPPGISRIYGVPAESEAPDESGRRFDNVQVQLDGTLRSGETSIRLHGILLPDRRTICTRESGARWACGLSAIGALRGLVQRRSMTCRILEEGDAALIGACRTGNFDLSVKLIEDGWAELQSDIKQKSYLDAARFARSRGVGLWGDGMSLPK
jgi:endonuclease YncB( thermonuclease family)